VLTEISFAGRSLDWTTAPGVFARHGLDEGSRLLLECLDPRPGQWLLDAGCGTGVLGLLPHLACPGLTSVLIDVNPVALCCAAANARRLGISRSLVVQAGAEAFPFRPAAFDVAVVNPPIRAGRKVVEGLLGAAIEALRPGGDLLVVVRVRQGGWTIEERLRERTGVRTALLARRKGYLVFRCRSPAGDTGPDR
jgi:16S rRNA (guanine1207-N2)-methyltransferase